MIKTPPFLHQSNNKMQESDQPKIATKTKNYRLQLIKPLHFTALESVRQRSHALDEIDRKIAALPDIQRLKHEPSLVLFCCQLLENIDSIRPPLKGEEKKQIVIQKLHTVFMDWHEDHIGKLIDFICQANLVTRIPSAAVVGKSILKKLVSLL